MELLLVSQHRFVQASGGFNVFGSSVVNFAGSGVGLILLAIGQTVVVICACSDMVRALSVPRSHRRYLASTVFRTLAIPSIIATGMSVLIDALSWSWTDVCMSMFVMVAIIFRLHHDKDEDSWWKGKGKRLARWARHQFSSGTRVAPAAG
ncbi:MULTISPECIES: hypothetical protein [Pseudarthrobacter]|uniref:hypothetical protein n=1 Tax=Pseudarthrobacter TaxID=1742993 RepID=UPI001FCB1C1D|nr:MULTISPECIES: hypothetical protein [Pseudarthrobacter]MDP9999342.1 Co/Zn/Cd efflux system component [Pseudarthrobacter sulfonivorans]